jgi:dUTPase
MSCIVKLKPYDENRFFHIPSYASPHSAGKDIKASIQ